MLNLFFTVFILEELKGNFFVTYVIAVLCLPFKDLKMLPKRSGGQG